MHIIAEWLWNPVLCLLYLEIGIIFVGITGAIAWRKSFGIFKKILKNDESVFSDTLVSHTKGFFASISTTVGIGNLAGVGTALHLGGPGALFWMWVAALLGMSFKMSSTYLAVKYRPSSSKSILFATPMSYLEKYMKGVWRFIPSIVAGLILVKGLVLANLVQANSISHALHNRFEIPDAVTAIVLTLFVGIVILGGLKKVVNTISSTAPWMMLLYVIAGVIILLSHPFRSLEALRQVFFYAFNSYSVGGGIAGYAVFQSMQFGVSRGIFSNMSGEGISPFMQAANKEKPAISAFMSALNPFFDTVVICTITGLVILSTPLWRYATGAFLTSSSFESGLGIIGQIVVICCLIVFAFTTIVGFGHISEKCFIYLGGKDVFKFRIVFLIVTFIGPFLNLVFVWSLSDVIIAFLIIFHLIPLLYITLRNLPEMLKDLNELVEQKKRNS